MTVTSATGTVKPIASEDDRNGAGGDLIGQTAVTSFGGISGIVDGHNGMFLVGVFLTDQPPTGEGPERLDFTDHEDFADLAPQTGQTFFIGDGSGRRYVFPSGASRLFLGFADAYAGSVNHLDRSLYYQGAPGFFDNNKGWLAVTVEFSAD